MSSLSSIFNVALASLSTQGQTMARLQEEAASGERVIRASDDPGDAYQVMSLTSQASSLATYSKNIDNVTLNLNQASSSLEDISKSLTQVQSLLSQAANATYSDANRRAMAGQINSILEQVLTDANTASQGSYLFGGSSLSVVPYNIEKTNGQITGVTYQGSQQDLYVSVAPGVKQSSILNGNAVFSSNSRKAPVFLGNTGAQAASGTSSARGNVWMQVMHGITTYGGATGVAAGSGSAAGDTILGNRHSLKIDFDNKTVSLDDGSSVAFTPADTNLALTNAAGDRAYVDMSTLDGALTGTSTVAIQSAGKVSIDDGKTTQDIDFSSNQTVTNGTNGQVLYVDGSGITRTGVEPVQISGTYDLFNTLIQVRDLMNNTHNLSTQQQAGLLNDAISAVTEVTAGVSQSLTNVGSRIGGLSSLQQSLDNSQSNVKDQADSIQSADITQVAVDLSKAQTFYQMTLAAAAKVMNLSLLDYMK